MGSAQNLLSNPAFTDGNVGFQTGYTYFTGSPIPEGRYAIARSPREHHPLQADFGDHTSGTGLMMVVNGGTLPNVYDYPVWQEAVPVVKGAQYVFTGWTTTADASDGSPAQIAARVNGQTVLSNFAVPSVAADWRQFTFVWSSGEATSATISLFDTNTAANGNDFVLDDLSFSRPSAVPEPSTLNVLGVSGAVIAASRRKRRAR